jgi:hypothetical protein
MEIDGQWLYDYPALYAQHGECGGRLMREKHGEEALRHPLEDAQSCGKEEITSPPCWICTGRADDGRHA